MKIIYNNFIPFRGYVAMMLFGVIFARKKHRPLAEQTINHEAIHAAQARDCGGWWRFYARYLGYWVLYGFSYRAIPFEREAYAKQRDLNYLKNRETKAFKKYL
jgi:hypothetical protein